MLRPWNRNSGYGHAQLEHLDAPMTGLNLRTFKEMERRVGKHNDIEQIATQSCQKWQEEEEKTTGGIDLTIAYDMG